VSGTSRGSAGSTYLAEATTFLTACRREQPLGGMWDAADLQWWWREDAFGDPLRQRFYDDDAGRAVALLLLEENHRTFDYELLPGLEDGALARRVVRDGLAWLGRTWDPGVRPAFYLRDDHRALQRLAEERGFVCAGGDFVQTCLELPAPDVRAPLPAGFGVRPIRAADVVNGRQPVLATPAAGIERLRETTLYRPDHHLVVTDPAGRAVAECIFWVDDVNRIGVFEPVATAPSHRRLGIARAMLAHGLERTRRHGVRLAKVSFESTNAAARGLYFSLGFQPRFARLHYRREARLAKQDPGQARP
jgi:ribosomal protein S18 acetylase RimI-like enzyme